jgi:hypothetical protein
VMPSQYVKNSLAADESDRLVQPGMLTSDPNDP